jgi:hypothetical protein
MDVLIRLEIAPKKYFLAIEKKRVQLESEKVATLKKIGASTSQTVIDYRNCDVIAIKSVYLLMGSLNFRQLK